MGDSKKTKGSDWLKEENDTAKRIRASVDSVVGRRYGLDPKKKVKKVVVDPKDKKDRKKK